MADEAVIVAAPAAPLVDAPVADLPTVNLACKTAALTPPTSEDNNLKDGSSSELSDLELDDDDIGEIEPDHYYDGGKVPVFKPVRRCAHFAGAFKACTQSQKST